MVESLIAYIENTIDNAYILTFILSMLPVSELRGAIPWAYFFTEIPLYLISAISIAGNFIITIPIINILKPSIKLVSRWPAGERLFDWILNRTRRKGDMIKKYHFWGLVLFVGIPLPVTGAWTGCIAAHLFGIPKLKALAAIMSGLCLSGTIVSILLMTGNWIIN
jgi:uncharacterized membrane protein